jgi:hypothetical protein
MDSKGLRPFLDVFLDRGCEIDLEPALPSIPVIRVDVLRDEKRLNGGGVLLLGARTADGDLSLKALRDLRRRNPHLIVFLCTGWERAVTGSLARYTRAGLDRYFPIGSQSDLSDLVQFLSMRVLAPPPEIALRSIATLKIARLPSELMRHAFRNSQCAESMVVVAKRFGHALRTLEGWLHDAMLPGANMLFRCGRFLHLQELDQRGVRDVDERALRLGFDTPTDLRQWRWRLRRSAQLDQRMPSLVRAISLLEPLLNSDENS